MICTKCSTEKESSEFSKDRSTTSGFSLWCKECTRQKNRAHYLANRERVLAEMKAAYALDSEVKKERLKKSYAKNRAKRVANAIEYKKENPERQRKWGAISYKRNRDRVLAQQKIYASRNPEVFRAKAAARRASVKRATPLWVNLHAIGEFYEQARNKTLETGVSHAVDHVVPLIHPDVCGLHVPWNLQVLTLSENASKSNDFASSWEVSK